LLLGEKKGVIIGLRRRKTGRKKGACRGIVPRPPRKEEDYEKVQDRRTKRPLAHAL